MTIQPANYLPSAWVDRFLPGVALGGRVLDVACGAGRHLQLYLSAGLRAVGIDRDISRAESYRLVPGFELIEADLEAGAPPPFAGDHFEGVVVTNYLWRPLMPAIIDAVAGNGILIYETFAVGNERFGRPHNPDFLLRPGELVDAVHPRLTVVAFEHVRLEQPDRIVQRIAAVGPRHPWRTGDLAAAPLPVSRLKRRHPS
ncbi:MAG: class I SAM-dependent methyltransferase [Hyphomicrobiaceae bacterium]|nr:class I SAM-dependent methyltransferase [Hyphomicrobiaceae bacterium]